MYEFTKETIYQMFKEHEDRTIAANAAAEKEWKANGCKGSVSQEMVMSADFIMSSIERTISDNCKKGKENELWDAILYLAETAYINGAKESKDNINR